MILSGATREIPQAAQHSSTSPCAAALNSAVRRSQSAGRRPASSVQESSSSTQRCSTPRRRTPKRANPKGTSTIQNNVAQQCDAAMARRSPWYRRAGSSSPRFSHLSSSKASPRTQQVGDTAAPSAEGSQHTSSTSHNVNMRSATPSKLLSSGTQRGNKTRKESSTRSAWTIMPGITGPSPTSAAAQLQIKDIMNSFSNDMDMLRKEKEEVDRCVKKLTQRLIDGGVPESLIR